MGDDSRRGECWKRRRVLPAFESVTRSHGLRSGRARRRSRPCTRLDRCSDGRRWWVAGGGFLLEGGAPPEIRCERASPTGGETAWVVCTEVVPAASLAATTLRPPEGRLAHGAPHASPLPRRPPASGIQELARPPEAASGSL